MWREGFSIPLRCVREESSELQKSSAVISYSKPSLFEEKTVASLVLEDGTVFKGYSFGTSLDAQGEAVFSTSMVGYPEALTDPSYRGQILCLTYPLVGNYGVPSYEVRADGLPVHFESDHVQVRGLIVHEVCDKPSHYQSRRTLDEWLRDDGIPGIFGVDTRRLARVLRERGVMLASIKIGESVNGSNGEGISNPYADDLIREVSVSEPIVYHPERKNQIALLDCGVKFSIIRNLLKRGVGVVRFPYDAAVDAVMQEDPVGVVVSNGPGDPKTCRQTIRTVQQLIEADIPILGICLGNQLIALAEGADTYKMKYGHRSQNQPVLDLETGRCYITTQNHGFAVEKTSLENSGLQVWFVNANDRSIEGIKHPKKPYWGVQWHPEACPGPTDTEFIFDFYLKEVVKHAKT